MDSQPLPPDAVEQPVATDDGETPDPTEVKPAWYWIKDARGYGSVTVTFVFIAFWVTTFAYVMSIIDHVGTFVVRPFDVAACSGYFIPLLTMYVTRKYTEAKFNSSQAPK